MIGYDDIPNSFNLTSWFLDARVEEGRGDRVALYVGDDRAVTYAELARLTNRVGHVLREAGVRPEQRVLLAVSDGAEFVASWYAAIKIGAVVAEVYTFLPEKDYEYYLSYTRAALVVVDGTTVERVRAAAARVTPTPRLLVVGVDELREGEIPFAAAVASAPDELDPAPTGKDDIALWKFTTGSTGAPKAAVHAMHDPVVSFAGYALETVGYREDDVVLPVPKLFFGYARDATALFTFGVGAAGVAFPDRSTPDRLFDLVELHRPTIMVQVPTMMAAMLDHPRAAAADLSSLRLVLSSGEALPEEVHRRWLDHFGGEVLEGVGSSELYHIYLSNRPGRVRPGSAGEPVPGYTARLVDERGVDVPVGETGELRVAGESAALMYWNAHQSSKRTFAGDSVRTGDVFERDADGYFWYRGRADDLLKVGGIWVAPVELENALLGHRAVAECAVVAYEDGGLTLPRAYVVLRAGGGDEELARALQEHVKERLSPHKYPRDVRFVEELPKTSSGKIDRRRLRESDPARAT